MEHNKRGKRLINCYLCQISISAIMIYSERELRREREWMLGAIEL